MALKYLSLIVYLLFFLRGDECPVEFVVVDGVCYYKKHLDVLQDFIDENQSLDGMEPQEIGYQEWKNNRLTYLYLGDNFIESIPDSIGLLKDLNNLDLRKNKIKSVPEAICNIYPIYTNINLSGNQICPPYPNCFDYIGDQEIKDCNDYSCSEGYLNIEGECYKEDHIQVLQAIINSNSVLSGLTPLELGKEIGYQGWEYGKLTHLNLVNNQLMNLPEILCTIYPDLKTFDVSNNSICPPYPVCFEYLGHQNTQDCDFPQNSSKIDSTDNIIDNFNIVSTNDVVNINAEYFQKDLNVLQALIDHNESLRGQNPLGIGKQKWTNMRLSSLDLSLLGITYLPEKLCDIYYNLANFDVRNNEICPPYPGCIEYVGEQKTAFCADFFCPENYIEIDGGCYHSEHISFLEALIDSNSILQNTNSTLKPLDVGGGAGFQDWRDGKIERLVLADNSLTKIPESVCNIYNDISLFDISNNAVCPPYPPCIENVGRQDMGACGQIILSCSEGFVAFNDKCYYYEDLQVLIDFIQINPTLESYHPLLLGYQLWKNNRLSQLSLDGLNITRVPESVQKLDQLEYLNLNNNHLISLPDSLCNIYPNLKSFGVSNNSICPPYVECLEDVGIQNNLDCIYTKQCPEDCVGFYEDCYNYEDLQVLINFTTLNPSIASYHPLLLGHQVWENNRLHQLNLDGWNIADIPENFNKLDQLEYLNFNNNHLISLPDSLCNIYPNLKSFDVSNNSICPPYPACFEFIGYQNTNDCATSDYFTAEDSDNDFVDNRDIVPTSDIVNISAEYFQNDISVLQALIDHNESLRGQNPLGVGKQKWTNMRLSSLDLSSLGITYLPQKLCDIYSNLTNFDAGNNEICPPYPRCFDYISGQNTKSCFTGDCPVEYMEIEGECYHSRHIEFLEALIDSNAGIWENSSAIKPLDIASDGGVLIWENGKINQFVFTGSSLTKIPENICNIYYDVSLFNISNNTVCPPYPACLDNIGYQKLDGCELVSSPLLFCPDGFVSFDDKCYYNDDLRVLIDFTNVNLSLENYHPLQIGYQIWKNNRLLQLYIDDMNIITIPESIHNLDHLEHLSLNNNQLETLPESICNIYSNLKSLNISNNFLCPPYPNCFDFLGQQNTINCEYDSCFYGYTEIDGECYYEKDMSVLQDFIDLNESLKGKKPLEIGVQKWKNNRLYFLYLGVNQLSEIPNSICEIHSNLRKLNISQNNICPPYPDCIEKYVGEQNISGCAQ